MVTSHLTMEMLGLQMDTTISYFFCGLWGSGSGHLGLYTLKHILNPINGMLNAIQ